MRAIALPLLLAVAAVPLGAAVRPDASHRTRLLRAWNDTVKEGGDEIARRYEIVYDYTDAVALELVYDGAGTLLSSRPLLDAPPRPSAEEFEEAIAIVQADAEIGEIARRTGGIFEGGFLLEGAQAPCGAGTRCVEVQILDRGRYAAIRKVVVDLVAQRIAVRASFPPPITAEQPAGEGAAPTASSPRPEGAPVQIAGSGPEVGR